MLRTLSDHLSTGILIDPAIIMCCLSVQHLYLFTSPPRRPSVTSQYLSLFDIHTSRPHLDSCLLLLDASCRDLGGLHPAQHVSAAAEQRHNRLSAAVSPRVVVLPSVSFPLADAAALLPLSSRGRQVALRSDAEWLMALACRSETELLVDRAQQQHSRMRTQMELSRSGAGVRASLSDNRN